MSIRHPFFGNQPNNFLKAPLATIRIILREEALAKETSFFC